MEQAGEGMHGEFAVPRVLVVDDDPAIRSLLRESLEDAGCIVEEAGNGREALTRVGDFRPDLLLLDVVMPEMDGYETCGRIHELCGFEGLPVLMMTALDDVEYVNRAFDSGAADVVSKPLNWVALIHRIRQLIETARLIRRLDEAEGRHQALLDAAGLVWIRLQQDGYMSEVRGGDGFRELAVVQCWQGRRIEDVVPPPMAERFLRGVRRSLESGCHRQALRGFSLGRERGDYELTAVPSGAEETTVILGTVRGPSEDAPSRPAGFFQALAEASPDPLFVLNSAGRIEYENHSARLALRKLKGRRNIGVGGALDFVHSEDADALFNGIVETLERRGGTHRLEFRVRDRSGSWRMWDGRIVNLLEDPNVGGLFLACRDITRLKQNESELAGQRAKAQAMDQAKSEYLAVVSHELRSPLNTIMGHAELMLGDMLGALTEKQAASLRRIRKSAREVLDLTFSVLDLTRLEAGALPLDYQEVSVAEVLQEIRDEVEIQAGSGVEVTWSVDKHLRTLYTDRAKFKMILRNLVHNAIRFTRAGCVGVDVRHQDGRVELRVTDTGIGIPRDKHRLIFEPFESARDDATVYEGHGLGLYIVKRFVDLLGGEIGVQSSPGEGASFTVSLATKH